MSDSRAEEALRLPWAILPQKLAAIEAVIHARRIGVRRLSLKDAAREKASREELREEWLSEVSADSEIVSSVTLGMSARIGRRTQSEVRRAVGVIPIHGTILPRGDRMTESSGITTTTGLRRQLDEMMGDDSIGSVVLDIDSPGGFVAGIRETFDAILAARKDKRIVAQVWDTAASAAFWLAAAADEIVATPSAFVGSIGVFSIHMDETERLRERGLKPTVIRSTQFKAEGVFEPLSKSALAHRQAVVDEQHEVFVADVARGRGVDRKEVEDRYGSGRMLSAEEAVGVGMIDRIGSFRETVTRTLDDEVQPRAAAFDTTQVRARRSRDLGLRLRRQIAHSPRLSRE